MDKKDMVEKVGDINHIVVVGAWNMAILTQDWVKTNVLYDVEKYTIEYPISGGGSGSLRYITDDFLFFIVPGRLLINLNKTTEQSSMKAVECARRIFRLLAHTPVEALGINYVFELDGRNKIFDNLVDTSLLTKAIEKPVASTEITRHFQINETEALNFTAVQTDKKTLFNFNFDFKVHTPIDIINIFGDENDIIVKKRAIAQRIITDLYKDQQQ